MRLRLMAAVAVLALVMAACTDSSDTTTTTTEGAPEPTTTTEGAPEPTTTTTQAAPEPTTTTAPEPTITTAPEPTTEPAELRLALADIGNQALDPILSPVQGVVYLSLIFDSLVGVDQAGQEFSKETGIASDWQVSDDGLTYTFQLREGVKFHNGDDVTAEDVKFTLERLGAENAINVGASQIAGSLESVTVNGPYEVEVKLLAPNLATLTLLSPLDNTAGFIVPKNYIEQVGKDAFAESPVGSGPYTLANRQVGVSIELERADGQHFAITPRFERVTMSVVPEETTRIAMLQTGEADFIDVSIDKVPSLTGEGFGAFAHGLGDPLWLLLPAAARRRSHHRRQAARGALVGHRPQRDQRIHTRRSGKCDGKRLLWGRGCGADSSSHLRSGPSGASAGGIGIRPRWRVDRHPTAGNDPSRLGLALDRGGHPGGTGRRSECPRRSSTATSVRSDPSGSGALSRRHQHRS